MKLGEESRTVAASPDTLWYKDAIIYQLHVRTFCDSNGDGIGDFPGLTQSWTICKSWESMPSGCCRSFPRPYETTATTFRLHRRPPKLWRLEDFKAFLAAAHDEGCASSLSWFSTTRLTSTPGSRNREALARTRSAIGTSGVRPIAVIQGSGSFSLTQKCLIGLGIRSRSPIIGIDSSIISLT